MLPGYADESVDGRIIDGLRRRGMDVVTAQDYGQRHTDDEILLVTATTEDRLMITCDTDFLRIHNDWMTAGKNHAGIIFWPQNKRPIGKIVRRIFDYALQTAPADAANVVKYL